MCVVNRQRSIAFVTLLRQPRGALDYAQVRNLFNHNDL
jgi:hypothetical protein